MKTDELLLKNVGEINPISSGEYVSKGGYQALQKTIDNPKSVMKLVVYSGIRGRGGAGFPVGKKWSIVKEMITDEKYIVCNADEGEPGTNKDRILMTTNPHAIIEGMIIAGILVGAKQGIIYLRAEYSYIRNVLESAINDAENNNYLGANILNSKYNFEIKVRSGQGSYLCGEETALINSIEGKRGETRLKPPYPGEVGVYGKPTVINNVETMACVPLLITMGNKYLEYGTKTNPGTKLFTLSGNIKNPSVYELPIGVRLRDVYEEIGGGCEEGKKLKGIQIGGASGSIVTPEALDLILDIEPCREAGASMGTGSLIFIDEDVCIVDLCRNLIEFYADESCGKCTPCRLGTKELREILGKICSENGSMEDLIRLKDVAEYLKSSALCGLGSAAPIPILSALANFEHEFISHVNSRECLAGYCTFDKAQRNEV